MTTMTMVAMILMSGWLAGGAQGGAPVAIPAMRGTTFTGEAVALPDALYGKVGVLIVGFSQGSRREVADWGHKLADDAERPVETGSYYEMPVLANQCRACCEDGC